MKIKLTQTQGILLVYLALGITISLILSYVFRLTFLQGQFWGWSILVIITGLNIEHVLIIPEPNHAIVLQNELVRSNERNQGVTNQTDIAPPDGQRVLFSGFNLKWPWEIIVKEPISLEKIAPLEGTVTGQSSTDDGRHGQGIDIIVKWKGGLVPIPDDRLVWYHITPESEVVKRRKAEIELALKDMISKLKPEQIIGDRQKTISGPINDQYGGMQIVSDEDRTGRYVSFIVVESADKEKTSQDRDEQSENATKLAGIIRTMVTAAGNNKNLQLLAVAEALGTDLPPGIFAYQQGGDGKGKGKRNGNGKNKDEGEGNHSQN